MNGLNGARVALLEARMSDEAANLVRRHGGTPYSVPAVRESPVEASGSVATLIDGLSQKSLQAVIFLTGVGVKALADSAEKLGRLPELLSGLKSAITICRGPKPTTALTRLGVQVSVNAREPFTTAELLEAVATADLEGKGVAIVHYGERNQALSEALKGQVGRLDELCLYEWQPPEDIRPLKDLVTELINGRVEVIAFTSQVQARHLFQVAEESGRTSELIETLNSKLVVVSIGPTCTAALKSLGVSPHVEPTHPKMGAMFVAMASYVEQHPRRAIS
jgi:uroporphyrinogen-III synthase